MHTDHTQIYAYTTQPTYLLWRDTVTVAHTSPGGRPCPVDRSTLAHTDCCRVPDWCSCHMTGGRQNRKRCTPCQGGRSCWHLQQKNTGRGEI